MPSRVAALIAPATNPEFSTLRKKEELPELLTSASISSKYSLVGTSSNKINPKARCSGLRCRCIRVLGIAYSEFSDADRKAIVAAYPRTEHFKEDIIQAFYDGIKHKPESTFGNVKADVLADKDPKFQRINFCSVIRGSQWKG
jgi:hypothetical protein